MESSICLDTDILVEFIRNNQKIVNWIAKNKQKHELATTIINVFELYYGVYVSNNPKAGMEDVEELISKLTILNLSLQSAHEAGRQMAQLKKEGQLIEFRDILIGAATLTKGFSLKTNNKKHFDRIKGLKLV